MQTLWLILLLIPLWCSYHKYAPTDSLSPLLRRGKAGEKGAWRVSSFLSPNSSPPHQSLTPPDEPNAALAVCVALREEAWWGDKKTFFFPTSVFLSLQGSYWMYVLGNILVKSAQHFGVCENKCVRQGCLQKVRVFYPLVSHSSIRGLIFFSIYPFHVSGRWLWYPLFTGTKIRHKKVETCTVS